jgi:hypothetical protein
VKIVVTMTFDVDHEEGTIQRTKITAKSDMPNAKGLRLVQPGRVESLSGRYLGDALAEQIKVGARAIPALNAEDALDP